jgi:hypothetical protein
VASTRTYGGEGTPVEEQSLGELVATVTRDMSILVHREIELAKSELAEQAKNAGVGAGLLGAAGSLGLFGILLLAVGGGFGVAAGAGIPVWAGFLTVGGFLAVLAAAFALVGIREVTNVGPPQRSVSSVKADLAWAKHPRTAPDRAS